MRVDFHHSKNKHDKATKVSFLEERLKCDRLQWKIKEQEDKVKDGASFCKLRIRSAHLGILGFLKEFAS